MGFKHKFNWWMHHYGRTTARIITLYFVMGIINAIISLQQGNINALEFIQVAVFWFVPIEIAIIKELLPLSVGICILVLLFYLKYVKGKTALV